MSDKRYLRPAIPFYTGFMLPNGPVVIRPDGTQLTCRPVAEHMDNVGFAWGCLTKGARSLSLALLSECLVDCIVCLHPVKFPTQRAAEHAVNRHLRFLDAVVSVLPIAWSMSPYVIVHFHLMARAEDMGQEVNWKEWRRSCRHHFLLLDFAHDGEVK